MAALVTIGERIECLARRSVRIQRKVSGGLKAVTQTEKGLQEIFIRTEAGAEDSIAATIRGWV